MTQPTGISALQANPDPAEPAARLARRWYACYTRGHYEKRVAAHLQERQIESFLPTHSEEHHWSDRTKRVAYPLFPSYVFARFRAADLSCVLNIEGLVTIVRAGTTLLTIPDDEIANVRRFAETADRYGIAPVPEPFVDVGEHVRVTAGPLAGVEGIVLEWRRARTRVLIGLQAVGQGLSVNVDTSSLQRI